MFQTKVVEKSNTHILCLITFFENCAVCEIMWRNIAEPDKPQMKIWHTGCWIPKARNTLPEHVYLLLFHHNDGCTNTPQCFAIRTLPVMSFTDFRKLKRYSRFGWLPVA